jgi:hypothetical protein
VTRRPRTKPWIARSAVPQSGPNPKIAANTARAAPHRARRQSACVFRRDPCSIAPPLSARQRGCHGPRRRGYGPCRRRCTHGLVIRSPRRRVRSPVGNSIPSRNRRLYPPHRRHGASSGRHLLDGERSSGGDRCPDAGARHRAPARGRRLGDAGSPLGAPQCGGADDGRKGSGHD